MKKTTEQFINESIAVHNNRYCYNTTQYTNTSTPVSIVCRIHGEFKQTPKQHLSGSGCSLCNGGRTLSQDEFVKRSIETHGNRYSYTNSKYTKSDVPVAITCIDHGDFLQRPSSHISGQGCPECGNNRPITSEMFSRKANKIHNGLYSYDRVMYTSSTDPITITCHVHGDFNQTPQVHLSGSGCPECGIAARSGTKYNTADFTFKAQNVHGDLYDYSLVKYTGAHSPIVVICPQHGEFTQLAYVHLNGNGCPSCRLENLTLTTDEFIEKATHKHNNLYRYDSVEYINTTTNITIECKIHGLFTQKPSIHLQGGGCPSCAPRGYSSKCIQWLDWIQSEEGIYINHAGNGGEYTLPDLGIRVDGYCAELNMVFEFHGDYWHGNPNKYDRNLIHPHIGVKFEDLYNKTLDRDAEIRAAGYCLVTLWESDFSKIINI